IRAGHPLPPRRAVQRGRAHRAAAAYAAGAARPAGPRAGRRGERLVSLARLLRNVLIGGGALRGVLPALIGAWWLSVTEPWYDWDVVRQLRSRTSTHDEPWRSTPLQDKTPQLAALFPKGMDADAARSVLRSNGFSCASTTAEPGGDFRL